MKALYYNGRKAVLDFPILLYPSSKDPDEISIIKDGNLSYMRDVSRVALFPDCMIISSGLNEADGRQSANHTTITTKDCVLFVKEIVNDEESRLQITVVDDSDNKISGEGPYPRVIMKYPKAFGTYTAEDGMMNPFTVTMTHAVVILSETFGAFEIDIGIDTSDKRAVEYLNMLDETKENYIVRTSDVLRGIKNLKLLKEKFFCADMGLGQGDVINFVTKQNGLDLVIIEGMSDDGCVTVRSLTTGNTSEFVVPAVIGQYCGDAFRKVTRIDITARNSAVTNFQILFDKEADEVRTIATSVPCKTEQLSRLNGEYHRMVGERMPIVTEKIAKGDRSPIECEIDSESGDALTNFMKGLLTSGLIGGNLESGEGYTILLNDGGTKTVASFLVINVDPRTSGTTVLIDCQVVTTSFQTEEGHVMDTIRTVLELDLKIKKEENKNGKNIS